MCSTSLLSVSFTNRCWIAYKYFSVLFNANIFDFDGNFFLIIVLLAWVWLSTRASHLLHKCHENVAICVLKPRVWCGGNAWERRRRVARNFDRVKLCVKLFCESVCDNFNVMSARSAVPSFQPILQSSMESSRPSLWLRFLYLHASDVHQHTFNRVTE